MLGKSLIQAASGAGGAVGALGIEDVFSTWLYTGNGSTQTITNGIDLAGEGGLVWIKRRNVIKSNFLFDTVRGVNKYLISDQSDSQGTSRTDLLTAFNGDGFTLGADALDFVNESSGTYASWTFRKAPGFFDVVTYTGTGSARTVAHNLGSVPGTIIVKRTDTTADWQVYHRSLANTEYMVLNSTAAKATGTTRWNSTTPTSSVFNLGTDATVNASGGTYVAYLFAHDEQIFGEGGDQSVIKCGSYTGNGSTAGPLVDLGWEPQWVMIKNTTGSADDWDIFDNMRGVPSEGNDQRLRANLSNAEDSGVNFVDFNARGFQPRTTISDVNTSGSTYIYIAIRRGPMKTPTSGTEVFGLSARTGTGANATVAGGQLTDLVVIKNRGSTVTGSPLWAARLTGVNYLTSTSTAAEVAAATTILQSNPWDVMDGAKVGTTSTLTNASGNTFINYLFRRAPGFFDVVAYTGTGVARTVPHNLGVAPELMIVKRRNLTESWQVYVVPVSPSSTLELNTTNGAAAYTNRWDGASTATEIKLLTHASVNASGSTYIAYLFATLPGISKVGNYTGTGATLNIDCGFTAGARLVIIKRTDSTGDWYVWDTARGIISGNDPYMLINSTAAEVTSTDYIDPLSSGFQISSTAPAGINASGGSYIYLSIA